MNILILLLVIIAIFALPGTHVHNFGYYPSGGIGLVILILLILLLLRVI